MPERIYAPFSAPAIKARRGASQEPCIMPAAEYGLRDRDTGEVYPLPDAGSFTDAYLAAKDARHGLDIGLLAPPAPGHCLVPVLLPWRMEPTWQEHFARQDARDERILAELEALYPLRSVEAILAESKWEAEDGWDDLDWTETASDWFLRQCSSEVIGWSVLVLCVGALLLRRLLY